MKTKKCNIVTVKKVEKYENFVRNYLKENNKNWLSKDEQKMIKKILGYTVTNDMRSKVEIYNFMKDRPKKYFLYIDEQKRTATTWTGDFLGNCFFGSSYRSNFGDKRINIDVACLNGLKYHGIYFKGAGDYARITAYK